MRRSDQREKSRDERAESLLFALSCLLFASCRHAVPTVETVEDNRPSAGKARELLEASRRRLYRWEDELRGIACTVALKTRGVPPGLAAPADLELSATLRVSLEFDPLHKPSFKSRCELLSLEPSRTDVSLPAGVEQRLIKGVRDTIEVLFRPVLEVSEDPGAILSVETHSGGTSVLIRENHAGRTRSIRYTLEAGGLPVRKEITGEAEQWEAEMTWGADPSTGRFLRTEMRVRTRIEDWVPQEGFWTIVYEPGDGLLLPKHVTIRYPIAQRSSVLERQFSFDSYQLVR